MPTSTDKSWTHTQAVIRTLGWPCAVLLNYKWAHKGVSHKTCCYWIHSFRGYIRRESERETERVYVLDKHTEKIKERKSLYICTILRVRTQTESIIINRSLVSVCFLLLKLPWLTLVCKCCVFVRVCVLSLSCLKLCSVCDEDMRGHINIS